MKVLVDADACPVVGQTVALCRKYGVECILLCDTAHQLYREGASTLVFDKGADSVDFALVSRLNPKDIVVTQDYGLASMCLAKQGVVLHQDGWEYTEDNIDALLFARHAAKKARMAGKRMKGPAKRDDSKNKAFETALEKLLQQSVQG